MQSETIPKISRVERDSGLFFVFMTLVLIGMYIITVLETPSVRQPLNLVIFTALTIIHLLLHLLVMMIVDKPRYTTWYIIIQGVLAIAITYFAKNLGMTFAMFMALLGEAIGMFRLRRKGLLASVYYLALLVASQIWLTGWAESSPILLTTIPVAVFVVLFVSLYMRQNEAREKAQALATDLESANRRLAEYATQVEELTLAAERRRMARELHDTLSQGVAGLVLQLEAIKAHLEAGRDERAGEVINQSLRRARSTLADSRAAIDDLRLAPANLPEAMRLKTERFTQATGIPCELELDLGGSTLPPDTGDHLLRVLNEALANVTRHAQASQVWVSLDSFDGRLELHIRDDGLGFDPGRQPGGGHYGLLGMRERARLLGGSLEIESRSGQGTRIRLVSPFPADG